MAASSMLEAEQGVFAWVNLPLGQITTEIVSWSGMIGSMSEERILQLIKESLKSAKSVEYKNTAQADELLRQAIELARKERFTKESFLEACAEVLMSLFPEEYRQNEKQFRDVFREGLEAGLTLDYCYERCLQGLDELVRSDPSIMPRVREVRLSARKVYIDMSLEELNEL